MAAHRFRLARALEWYREQSRLEASRLFACDDAATKARAEIDRHREGCRTLEMDVIRSRAIEARELSALESWRHSAKAVTTSLDGDFRRKQGELERQRAVTLEAQRRLRLTEKLRDRRLAEHTYQADRELEELASDSYLAAFARDLHSPTRKS